MVILYEIAPDVVKFLSRCSFIYYVSAKYLPHVEILFALIILVAMSTTTAMIAAGVSTIAMLVIVMVALHIGIVVQTAFN